jgi:hypothetical protein
LIQERNLKTTKTETKMKTVYTVSDTTVDDHQLEAFVIVKRNHTTANVSWDIGSFDRYEHTSSTISNRLEAAGMRKCVIDWFSDNKSNFGDRAQIGCGVGRWGGAKYLPANKAAIVALPSYQSCWDQLR